MKTIDNIPEGKYIIGVKEIEKGIKEGKIKKIIVAKNCPGDLISKLEKFKDTEIEMFNGSQKDLGTKLGKPFPVATVGVR